MLKQCKKCGRCYHQSINSCFVDGESLGESNISGKCPICGGIIGSGKFCFNDGSIITFQRTQELVGHIIKGRYLIEAFLDQTEQFTNYLGEDVKTQSKVIIMAVHPSCVSNKTEENSFKNAAQKAFRIKHKSLLNVIDYSPKTPSSEEKSSLYPSILTYYIVTEGVAETASLATKVTNLEDFLKDKPILSNDYKLTLLKEICSGLEAISNHEGYFPYFYPEEVVIFFPKETKQVVKIRPFIRIERHYFEPPPPVVVGKAEYFSREYCGGGNILSAKSTVYSFGILIYYLLTYKFPYEANSAGKMALKHAVAEPIPLTERDKTIPLEVENLVLKMLSKKPEDRPSFSELIGLLEDAWKSFDKVQEKDTSINNFNNSTDLLEKKEILKENELNHSDKPRDNFARKIFLESHNSKLAEEIPLETGSKNSHFKNINFFSLFNYASSLVKNLVESLRGRRNDNRN
jgi:serine/threonine-protein kinase